MEKSAWKNMKVVKSLFYEQETNEIVLMYDPAVVA